ncbi:HAMP domain-containing protein, partial [bacterium]|nr:HAMP domain-containing protein [bacterium]
DDTFANVYALGRVIAWVSLALIALGVVAALLLSRLITLPIKRLLAFAEAVASGDFKAKSEIKHNDEIGKLKDSIQHMVNSLVAKMDEADMNRNIALKETEKANLATSEAIDAKARA